MNTLMSRWVEALRSGKYEQGRDMMRSRGNTFCCLGVLCDVIDDKAWVLEYNYSWADGEWSIPPPKVTKKAGLNKKIIDTLIDMNDKQGKSFAEIADYLERL